MFLVMGITGKVGGATAEHLLAHGKKVRALVRNREKAANWANQGVDLVEGDWNDSAAIEQALKGGEGAFVMLSSVWAPSPDYKEAKGVIANYIEALTKAAPPRVVALLSMALPYGPNRIIRSQPPTQAASKRARRIVRQRFSVHCSHCSSPRRATRP